MEGNQMKMREALVDVKKSIDGIGKSSLDCDPTILMDALTQVCARLSARIELALSAPPRNCDVGTAEEQAERMRLYCDSHGVDESGCFRCEKCPFLSAERCELAWAQMTYEAEEGVRK